MRREVTAILRRAATKLLLTRTAESAGAGGTGGGLAAAALVLALTFARSRPVLALLICLLPVAGGLGLALSRRLRRILAPDLYNTVWIASVSVAAGAAGAAMILTGAHAHVPGGPLAAAVLAGSALGGGLIRLVRGVSLQEAAEFLDARASLNERLATAAELAASPRAAGPVTEAVYEQALTVLRDRRPHRDPMWRRTRAAAAALLMAVLLCATVALLPGPRGAGPEPEQLARAMQEMSPEQRRRIAEALRAAARSADPRLAAELGRAAKLVHTDDPEQLAELIRNLRREGFRPVSVIPGDILAAAGFSPDGAGGGTNSGGPAKTSRDTDHAAVNGGPEAQPDSGTTGTEGPAVRVFHPLYGRSAAAATEPATGASPPPERMFVDYTTAWSAARDRAADALARGEVPARYRRIVRSFFLDEQ